MVKSFQHEILKLEPVHQCDDFDCGQRSLNDYLQKYALSNEANRFGRTYVARDRASGQVDGFFTISMSSVMFVNLPVSMTFPGMPKYPMPVVLLGCLAVRKEHQGKGLGGRLLIDAFSRVFLAAELVAARAMEVRAIDKNAKDWYEKKGFKSFVDHPDHMFIPMDVIRQTLAIVHADR